MNTDNILKLCNFSRLSYEDDLQKDFVGSIEDLVALSDEDTDAQGYIGVFNLPEMMDVSDNEEQKMVDKKCIVVCFRGTESLKDLLTDLNTVRIPFKDFDPKKMVEEVVDDVVTKTVMSVMKEKMANVKIPKIPLSRSSQQDATVSRSWSVPSPLKNLKQRFSGAHKDKDLESGEELETEDVVVEQPVKEISLFVPDEQSQKDDDLSKIRPQDDDSNGIRSQDDKLSEIDLEADVSEADVVVRLLDSQFANLIGKYTNPILDMFNPFKFLDMFTSSGPTVHWGFMHQYNSLKSDIKKYILEHDDIDHIVLCGHSLGGSLATLAAADIALSKCGQTTESREDDQTDIVMKHLTCVTFGSSRVGCVKFTKLFDSLVDVSVRVVNDTDPIPLFPRCRKYSHVAGELVVKNEVKEEKFSLVRRLFNFCSNMALSVFGHGMNSLVYHSSKNYCETLEEHYEHEASTAASEVAIAEAVAKLEELKNKD